MYTESIWLKECEIAARPKLQEDIETEIAVIGAGLAGVLIAHRLQQAGKQVVVLEAERIAGGQTKNTTAKITAQHGFIYDYLLRKFGLRKATAYATANMRAIEWYKKMAENIDCDFIEQDAYIYSLFNTSKLKAEAKACREVGLPAEFVNDIELPFNVAGAVRMKGQAQFQPLRFIKALVDELTIYENTRVKEVKDNTLFCDYARVEAEKIVFACHYPFVNFPGLYFTRMHQERSYVLALTNVPKFSGMYIRDEKGGYSFRYYKDLLLLGGGGHRTGDNKSGGKYELLKNTANRLFPECKEVARWSAQDCITADGIPYIGRFSKGKPDWYVATGFGKWGMTTASLAAEIITDLICGKENAATEVFTPTRISLNSAIGIAKEGMHSAKGLIKENLIIPRNALENLEIGQGGIVEFKGEKLGVYRKSETEYYCVDTRCPHLGCRLEWNPDEKSWDCPCHGSRYDYTGKLIDNPAQKKRIDTKI